ncbi:3'-5' exonuclease [Clostridium diolis]|uniref:3'-5' exonuclease n=1 Tax=Clostridium diolis TaxID=223919 RepID=UPI0015C5E509|nr:3'-5' exonuclease [Clostridium diolis]
MSKKILFIDTETGGIDAEKHSLLSIGLVIWEDKRIIDSKEFFIKHETFNVTPTAMKINKIDFQEFLKVAKEPHIILSEIMEFLKRNFNNNFPVVLGGHNTNFDISFFKNFLMEHRVDFNSLFSYRFIDTSSILKYLYYANIVTEDISSADAAFEYFNIDVKNRHSALGDAIATAELFNHLLEIIN